MFAHATTPTPTAARGEQDCGGGRLSDSTTGTPEHDAPTSGADRWIALAVFGLAVLVRTGQTVSAGGLQALYGYDDGVYFSAAVSFAHGLMPYQDFVLLHPPGIMVIAAGPVWLLSHAGWTDSDVLAAVRLAFVGLGGLNAVLMFLAGRNLSRATGVIAAGLYCVWLPVVRVERSILLEPLVIAGILAALAWAAPVSTRPQARLGWVVLAGLLGGLAVAVKLWAALPVVIVLVALMLAKQRRRALTYGASVSVSAAAVALPFAMPAPATFWSMVVTSQFGRPALAVPRLDRLVGILDLTTWPLSMTRQGLSFPTAPFLPLERNAALPTISAGVEAAVVLAVLVAVAAAIVAFKIPVARIWVTLLVAQTAALMATPVFFPNYASYVAPALLLVIAAVAHLAWSSATHLLHVGLLCLGTAALAVLGWGAALTCLGEAMPEEVSATVADARCVASDSMTAIALADHTTSNVTNGCTPVVDYSGVVYVLDYPKSPADNPSDLRELSPQFQDFAMQYIGGAQYVIMRRAGGSGLSRDSMAELRQRCELMKGPPVTLYGSQVPPAR